MNRLYREVPCYIVTVKNEKKTELYESRNRNSEVSLRYIIIIPCQCPVSLCSSARGIVHTKSQSEEGSFAVFNGAPWFCQSVAEGARMFIQKGTRQNWVINSLT